MLSLFLTLPLVTASLSPASPCLTLSDLEHEASPSLVQTVSGPLLGLRQTEIDPRRNQSVSWTSYFVSENSVEDSSSQSVLFSPGHPLRPASTGTSQVPSSPPSVRLDLPERRPGQRGQDLSSGQHQLHTVRRWVVVVMVMVVMVVMVVLLMIVVVMVVLVMVVLVVVVLVVVMI